MIETKYVCFDCSSVIDEFKVSSISPYLECPKCSVKVLKYNLQDHRILIDNDRKEVYVNSNIPDVVVFYTMDKYRDYTFLLSSFRPSKDIFEYNIEKFRLFTHFRTTLTRIIANLRSINVEVLDIGKYDYDILSILGHWSNRSPIYYVDIHLPNSRDRRILIGSELRNDREMILNRVMYMIASYILIL